MKENTPMFLSSRENNSFDSNGPKNIFRVTKVIYHITIVTQIIFKGFGAIQDMEKHRKVKIRKALKEMGKQALEKGWNGKMPSQMERDKIAREFLEKKGYSLE
jgi:hypothetical protein